MYTHIHKYICTCTHERSSYDAAQFRWNVEHYSEGSITVEVGAIFS